jgi:hypothetical protein
MKLDTNIRIIQSTGIRKSLLQDITYTTSRLSFGEVFTRGSNIGVPLSKGQLTCMRLRVYGDL